MLVFVQKALGLIISEVVEKYSDVNVLYLDGNYGEIKIPIIYFKKNKNDGHSTYYQAETVDSRWHNQIYRGIIFFFFLTFLLIFLHWANLYDPNFQMDIG